MDEFGGALPQDRDSAEKSHRRFPDIMDRVESVRACLGLNKSHFATSIGMKAQTYNNFIGAQGSKPSVELLHGVVIRHGVDPMWLFTGEGQMFLGGSDARPVMGREAGPPEGRASWLGGRSGDLGRFRELEPLLRRVETALEGLGGGQASLIGRLSRTLQRYCELAPAEAADEIRQVLEKIEKRAAAL